MAESLTVKDRLRSEYFRLLPAMQRTLTAIETEVRHILLPATLALQPHERIEQDEPIAIKYRGFWNADDQVKSEIQIASLLIGLFWEIEHSAIYKPGPNLRGRN